MRNALLKSFNLDNKISNIYNKNPDFLIDGEYSNQDIEKLIYNKGLTFIPIVNRENLKLVDILTLKKRCELYLFSDVKKNKSTISGKMGTFLENLAFFFYF